MDAVDKLIAEGRALTSALAVVEADGLVDEAQRECAAYLEELHVHDLESEIIACALRGICGLPLPSHTILQVLVSTNLTEDVLFHEGVARWLEWASGAPVSVRFFEPDDMGSGSTFNRMALTQWLEAVDHLRRGSAVEARRFFRRASTLGSLYGTVSNPVIQWTYAASFFPATSLGGGRVI